MNPSKTFSELRERVTEFVTNATDDQDTDGDDDEDPDDEDDEDEDTDDEDDGKEANTDTDTDDEKTNDRTTADRKGAGGAPGEWSVADSPTEKTLFGVVGTANGPYAVGTGGNVLARDGDGWHVAVADGPATRNNALKDVAVTAGGKRIWFAGSSGALGAYDVDTGKKYDYSAPMEKTSTWEAIAVRGERDAETLRVANGSGEVLPVTTDENGCPQWGEVVKPGSGSTIPALTSGGDAFYAVDTSGNAFVEREDGWKDIGVKNAQVNFFDVYATEKTVRIAGGGGRVYRYDRVCGNWTPVIVGDVAIHDLAAEDGRLVAAGADGRVYERLPKRGWTSVPTGTEETLWAVALGETDVAVGASGVIVERS
ncbi:MULTISPECIES: hypothetical protein [Halorussus]|uniref:hypothetical protein n=1 Tax=Halorussus TaxID=1070314 RepID=UPI00209F4CDF|nr:hypothetical protein [Halorussus vallis]USZ74263.1 hypothetical protein NGM07_12505 [Halorussus vallis]